MGTNKGSRKLSSSSSSPEGAVRFRHQSTGGADAVASLSFHRHRPLAKKKRIKSNGKTYNIKKATTSAGSVIAQYCSRWYAEDSFPSFISLLVNGMPTPTA